ncbi:MAG TPA: hypothetical protein VMF91_07610 [Bryobacteraceae bacterium]|nr:hypothetical protein [Bryobacteraceae bacterium]
MRQQSVEILAEIVGTTIAERASHLRGGVTSHTLPKTEGLRQPLTFLLGVNESRGLV